MADTPVEIEGNSGKFTISTQVTTDPQTGVKNVGDRIGIDPGGDPLQMRLTTTPEGPAMVVPLGTSWKIMIEKLGTN